MDSPSEGSVREDTHRYEKPSISSELSVPSLTAGSSGDYELLDYYRRRVDDFEQERESILIRLGEIDVIHEKLHKAKWDLKVRDEEIHELQKALSDSNVYLFDERQQILRLQSENDQLKMEQMEDRRRIQHLLALTQPVQQEVTFFRDCRPGKITQLPASGKSNASGRVLRTVYMPSERTDTMMMTIDSLKYQLSECQKLNDEKTASLLEDRRRLEESSSKRTASLLAEKCSLEDECRELQAVLTKTTRDLLEQRREFSLRDREQKEALHHLREENRRVCEHSEEVERVSRMQLSSLRETSSAESDRLCRQYRTTAMSLEEDLSLLRTQYHSFQKEMAAKLSEADSRERKWRSKCRDAEGRRTLEMEGYLRDISSLKSQAREVILLCRQNGLFPSSKAMDGAPPPSLPAAPSASGTGAPPSEGLEELVKLRQTFQKASKALRSRT